MRTRISVVLAAAAVAALVVGTSLAIATRTHHTSRAREASSAAVAAAAARMRIRRSNAVDESRRAAVAPPAASALSALRSQVLAFANASGDPQPTNAFVVPTTRAAAANFINGTEVTTDQPIYLVIVHGDFRANWASPPPGSPVPTGSELILAFDAQTLQLLDYGISDEHFKLNYGLLAPTQPLGLH